MNRNLIVVIIGLGVCGAHASEQERPISLLTEALKNKKSGLKRVETQRYLAVPEPKPSASMQTPNKTAPMSTDIWAQKLEEETAKIEAFSINKDRKKLNEAGIDVPNGPIKDASRKESVALRRHNDFFDELHFEKNRNKDGFALRWKLLQKIFQKVLRSDTVKPKPTLESPVIPVVQLDDLSRKDEVSENDYESGEDEFNFPV